MSRSGYTDDGDCYDTADFLRMCAYSGNVRRHIAGRAGQGFMWELYQALEALPERVLITETLADKEGSYCALGAVARYRGIEIPRDLTEVDEFGPLLDGSDFYDATSCLLDIKEMMAREVMYENDECGRSYVVPGPANDPWHPSNPVSRHETPEERWYRMRRWVVGRLRDIP